MFLKILIIGTKVIYITKNIKPYKNTDGNFCTLFGMRKSTEIIKYALKYDTTSFQISNKHVKVKC